MLGFFIQELFRVEFSPVALLFTLMLVSSSFGFVANSVHIKASPYWNRLEYHSFCVDGKQIKSRGAPMADTKMAKRKRTIENLKSNNFIILMRNELEHCQKVHTGAKNVLRKYFITVLKIYQDIMKNS